MVQRNKSTLKFEVRPELLQNNSGVKGDNGGKGSKHEAINIGFLIRISFKSGAFRSAQ